MILKTTCKHCNKILFFKCLRSGDKAECPYCDKEFIIANGKTRLQGEHDEKDIEDIEDIEKISKQGTESSFYLRNPGRGAITACRVLAWISLIVGSIVGILLLNEDSKNLILGLTLIGGAIETTILLLIISSIAENLFEIKTHFKREDNLQNLKYE